MRTNPDYIDLNIVEQVFKTDPSKLITLINALVNRKWDLEAKNVY